MQIWNGSYEYCWDTEQTRFCGQTNRQYISPPESSLALCWAGYQPLPKPNFCLSHWASGLVLSASIFFNSFICPRQTDSPLCRALPGSLCHKSKVARIPTVWNMDLLVFPVSKFQHFNAEKLCKLKHTYYVLSEKFSMTSVNSMWSSDAIWWHRSGSTLAQVMALCCQAQSHYLKQCWLCISDILWHSPKSNFKASAQAIVLYVQWVRKLYISQGPTS